MKRKLFADAATPIMVAARTIVHKMSQSIISDSASGPAPVRLRRTDIDEERPSILNDVRRKEDVAIVVDHAAAGETGMIH